jgi:hypothetical protein
MATWDDVRRLVADLPETAEGTSHGTMAWKVKGKLMVWERPLRASDLATLGDAVPDGEILGASVADEGVKQALIADRPDVYFTAPHFDGYAAVLVRLAAIDAEELAELVTEAWLVKAPKRLAAAFLTEQGG